jgi:nucleotide-binding universal stress UspA family protein
MLASTGSPIAASAVDRAAELVAESRHAGKTVASWAEYLGCRAIVVGAPEMSTWDRWLHGDEPRNVARRTKIPVHHVPLPPEPRRRSGFAAPREA